METQSPRQGLGFLLLTTSGLGWQASLWSPLSGSQPQLLATCHTLSGRWQLFSGKATDAQAVANSLKSLLGIVSYFPKELTPSSSNEVVTGKSLGYKETMRLRNSYPRLQQFQGRWLRQALNI